MIEYHLYRWSDGWALWKFIRKEHNYIVREFVVNSNGVYPREIDENTGHKQMSNDESGWSSITEEEAKKYKLEVL